MDLDQIPSDALEALATSGRGDASDTVAIWLSDLRAMPGNYPSLPTSWAYSVYRRWCADHGEEPIRPFAFAKLMGMRFRKRHARWGRITTRYIATDKATAQTLREAVVKFPPTEEEIALFSFAELRKQPRKDTR